MNLKHLGVIADGNRRWAKAQGLPTIEGHKKGLEAIEKLVEAAGEAGIYGFHLSPASGDVAEELASLVAAPHVGCR